MTKQRSTPEGLPLVDPSTIEVFMKDESQRVKEGEKSWQDYSQGVISRIQMHNPHLFYMAFCRHSEAFGREGKEEQARGYVQGFIAAYELFRRQAEANQMETDFNGQSSSEES